MRVLVVTMTWNRREVSCRWVPAVAERAGCSFRHVVVDQGSTDGTADALEAAGLEVVRSPTNVGIAAGWELGYRHALATGMTPEVVCRIDDDCELVTDGALARIVDFVGATGGRVVTSPLNVTMGERSDFFPKTVDPRTSIAGFKVKVVSHAGLFVAVPHGAFRRMLDDGGIRHGDAARGNYWASKGLPSVYLMDVHVAHRDPGNSGSSGVYRY